MNEEISGFIKELQNAARHEKREDHICWQAAMILQAIFDPENQPSQYGTILIAQETEK